MCHTSKFAVLKLANFDFLDDTTTYLACDYFIMHYAEDDFITYLVHYRRCLQESSGTYAFSWIFYEDR